MRKTRNNESSMTLTTEECDLIFAIRNYCNSFPNGHPDLLIYAQDDFQSSTLMPKSEQPPSPYGGHNPTSD